MARFSRRFALPLVLIVLSRERSAGFSCIMRFRPTIPQRRSRLS